MEYIVKASGVISMKFGVIYLLRMPSPLIDSNIAVTLPNQLDFEVMKLLHYRMVRFRISFVISVFVMK